VIADLQGKVAVVTGGASGIGRAMGERFLAEGMKVVLADVEAPALDATVEELQAGGGWPSSARTARNDGAASPWCPSPR
jgi:NAD(P)-dependent dehydrogenase (short-subunit alcohol dehydrogenase family)